MYQLWKREAVVRDAEVAGGSHVKEHDPGKTLGELELAGLGRVWVDVEESAGGR